MSNARILLAEDNPANIQLFEAILTRSGYDVEIAPDGSRAVALATRFDYDLILMDLGLPRLDGLAATESIRAAGGHCARVPIMALTAEDDARVERACRIVGMNGMIRKPISPATLIQRVKSCLMGDMRAAG